MASKFQFITELYSRTLTRLTGDYESWTGFLRSACYNYKCPFDEQVLIYAQRPDATAVLELEKWNRQFGRWVNAGATGIAVMDEARGKGRLKHYFDITDTHATRISRPVPIWSMEPAYTEPVIETLEATFGTLAKKDNLPDAILSASRNAVVDNMPDYLRDLLDCRGGSMLEELDALNVEVTYRRALESSVAYMLLTRLSLPAAAYILPEDFEDIYSFDTPTTINALGIATSDIAEMGLREISRTVMQARREQFFAKDAQIDYDVGKGQNSGETERSVEHGSDIQDAGGLSPAEPAAAPRGGGASGQVRGVEKAVHQEAPQGAVYESQDQRSVGGTSGGDRDGGGEDGDAAGGADGAERGRDGGAESRRSPALDGADEQPEAQRGGNGAERSDLQLNSTDENAGSAELPAFLDEHLIEAILLDDGGRKHTRQEIFAYFQANRDIATRTEFLKNSYNDIWEEVLAGTDKVRVGYHAQQDGLLMWEGSYLSRTSESVFSWGVVTEMTENLIERGAYKIKLGLQNAPVMAEQMSLFGMGGGTAVYEVPETQRTGELFPTRPVPQTVIDQTLYTAGNSRGSAERIAVFYMRQCSEAECVAFLRREFGTENGRGIEYEGKKYAVWFMEDGIHLAQGDSVRTGHSRTTVTWEQASVRILELLEAGTYLSAAELEQAQDKVLLEMGDALLMTARDLAQEGRAQGLFPQTLAIHDQRKGYPELDEDMVAFAKSEGGLAALAEEYHAFLSAYEQDRSIMRFRLSEYNTHRIGVVLDGIDLPERSFSAQPDFLRRCKMFITQDEIDQFFLADSVDSQLAVYSFFCYVAINLSFACSLRIGEIVGLTWDNIHISDADIANDNAYLCVEKELARVKESSLAVLGEEEIIKKFPRTMYLENASTVIVLKTPKTESSVRKVWMPKTVAYILREWKDSQDKQKEFLGDEYLDYNLVVALPNGRPCEEMVISNAFRRLKRDAKLPNVVFHSLRHSSTTYKLKLNHGDIKATQGIHRPIWSQRSMRTFLMKTARSMHRSLKVRFTQTQICAV